MDAHTKQLTAIFDTNISFQVPLFQRPYVWKEKNWEPLWDDIQSMADRRLIQGKTKPHFMGAVVLEQIPHASGSMETRLVIDGQQRFTTLQTFMIVARNLAKSCNANKISLRFAGLTENREDMVEAAHERYKLWPTNSDRAAFKVIHEARGLEDIERAVRGAPELGDSHLVGAYRFFHSQLTQWIAGEFDEPEDASVLAEKTVEDRLDSLWTVVREGLQLVVIDLNQNDETQVIFETLNARGTELLPADLIKNYLFRRAAVEAQDRGLDPEREGQKLFDRYWQSLESKWWRTEVKQGRVYRPRIDLFINHYLTLMMREEVKTTHLFSAFEEFVEAGSQLEGSAVPYPRTVAEHMAQLARYSEVYKRFDEPANHSALGIFMRRLNAVDTATVYPFMMYAHSELMPDQQAEFDKILSVLEAFLMRRLITNYTPKNYNRLFVDLIRAVERAGEVTAEVVGAQLIKGAGESTRFPSNDELRKAVMEAPLYDKLSQKKIRAILEALDAYNYSPKSEAVALPKGLTIEHVLPQQWKEHWPLPADVAADPVAEQKATKRRENLLHTLGNLTLITERLNPALSNGPWSAKLPALRKFSKLNLTRYFHDLPADQAWNEDAILRRSKVFFDQLTVIWPEVEVETVPA